MSARAIADALVTAFSGVEGLSHVQLGEPVTVHAGRPLLYVVLDGAIVAPSGQLTARRWRVLARLVVLSQDYTAAERVILDLADPILDAIDADPTLGGVIRLGTARVSEQRAVWAQIANVTYRCLDTTIEALAKAAR